MFSFQTRVKKFRGASLQTLAKRSVKRVIKKSSSGSDKLNLSAQNYRTLSKHEIKIIIQKTKFLYINDIGLFDYMLCTVFYFDAYTNIFECL